MAADTSSSAAASTPAVGAAATAVAAPSVEPIFARSVAAEVIISGVAISNDMGHLRPRHDRCVMATRNRMASIGSRADSNRSAVGKPRPGLAQDHLLELGRYQLAAARLDNEPESRPLATKCRA